MSKKHLLASLFVAFGPAAVVNGQTGLGTPVALEAARDTGGVSSGCVDCAPRFARPTLVQFARTVFAPNRSNLMPPQPIAELIPTKDGIARMIADGTFSPAEITAAKIKINEAQTEGRKAAVRYLASVDCHYYPEAELGLIAALRADRNESVRFEAAVALGTCRATTRKIIEALSLAALGQETDGNPSETSECVRQAARTSLNRALTSSMAVYPTDTPTAGGSPIPVQLANFYPPTYPLAAPSVSAQERELAEKISAPPSNGPPTARAPATPRTLLAWFQDLAGTHDTHRATTANASIDPRLRGLTPLGSNATLAIPGVPAPPSPSGHAIQ